MRRLHTDRYLERVKINRRNRTINTCSNHLKEVKERMYSVDMRKNILNIIGIGISCISILMGCKDINPITDDSEDHFLIVTDSIGIENGDDKYVFGKIRDVNYLANGTIVTIDQSYRRIRLYSSSGLYLSELVGNGVGPGEFNTPFFISPLGNNFILSAIGESKVMYFDSTLNFLKEESFAHMPSSFRPGCPIFISAVDETLFVGTNFFLRPRMESVEAGTELSLWNGNILERSYRIRTVDDFNPITYQEDTQIFSCFDQQTGRLYWADRQTESYVVNCIDVASDSEWVFIQNDCQPLLKSDSIIAYETEKAIQAWIEGTGCSPDFDFEIDPYYATINGLYVGPEGRLWVRKADLDNPYFKVYDLDGSYLFDCDVILSDWQDCGDWVFRITRNGFLATPNDPAIAPKVYILQLQVE